MALNPGDILRVTIGGILFGKTWEFSTFRSYVLGDTAATYNDILDVVSGQYTTKLAPIVGGNTIVTSLSIENLTNGVDIQQRAVNIGGTNNATVEVPAFVAYGFQILRENRSTRHGSARVPGVPEGAINGESVGLSTLVMQNAADFFGQQWVRLVGPTADFTLVPVIVGRVLTTVGDKEYYVYDLTRINAVVGASFRRLTTQNTRKA